MDSHGHRQRPRQTLASVASRRKPTARVMPPMTQEPIPQEDPPSFGETLAPRVYAWSTTELDYRPRGSDLEVGARSRVHDRSSEGDPDHGEFTPQALVSLCDGHCGPILEYLMNNLKTRSVTRQIQNENLGQSEAKARSRRAKDIERQQRTKQCQDTILSITKKRQEIDDMKERIKQQRQLSTLKKIHIQQSAQRKDILQEYRLMFQRTEGTESQHNLQFIKSTAKPSLQATLPKALEEVSQRTRQIVLENRTTADTSSNSAVRGFVKQLDQSNIQLLLESIKESKLSILTDVSYQDASATLGHPSDRETTELLKLFREHHDERVAQINEVMNRIAICEERREELYTNMRTRAHHRELENKADAVPQELEEARAKLKGLEAALDFIQAEQEIMVERVVSVDEQRERLEQLSKTSRTMDQRMTQKQENVIKVLEMIRLNLERVPALAQEVSDSISEDIQAGLRELSTLVQELEATTEDDWKTLTDLTTERQRLHSVHRTVALKPPTVDAQKLDELLQKSGSDSVRCGGVAVEGQWSLDQHILSVAGLQRQNLVQSAVAAKAQEMNQEMAEHKARMAESIRLSAQDFEESAAFQAVLGPKTNTSTRDNAMQPDALASQFEAGLRKTVHTLAEFDTTYQTKFRDDLLNLRESVEAAFEEAKEVAVLLNDGRTIQSVSSRSNQAQIAAQRPTQPLGRKRVRYDQ
ncbi:hypothetical protein EMPS_00811 [Entomortierella parvispora]|uniref:Uncharacterized protein n=1 Tax=Entomortierella parvispora TaxID=205924 RepID=A0A9P3H1S0_9FUNG|nr:hypothetical protein EMPS_00811 [Entomortierella parvispora]